MLGNLGKYRLDTRLGGGGMAEVFIASTIGAEGFSRRVAIKRVLPGYSENPQFSQMFVAEAQISSRLQHPNIVSVLDFDRDAEGRLFLVMELIEGKDLDAILATGLLPFPVVIFVLTEMLRGLGYAHDLPVGPAGASGAIGGADSDNLRGIVHRDVSPHNVLLSWEGAVKVSDFGIAKAREASEATASVFIKGKPAYMSPEQANGEPLDGRSDLFAVGIMLWEMLVGRRLFVGGDTRSLLAQVLFSPIPRPRQQRADVPRDLDHICMKLLERELPARYGSGEEIIADLLRCDDAPKGGREELVGLLAQRFAPEFPRRHSGRLASRPASAAEPVMATPLPFRPVAPQTPSAGIPSSTVVGRAAGSSADVGSAPPSPSSAGAWTGAPGGQSAGGKAVPYPGMPSAAMGSGYGGSMPPGAAGPNAGPMNQQGHPGMPGAPAAGAMGSVDQMMAAHTRTLPPSGTGPVRSMHSMDSMAMAPRRSSMGVIIAVAVGAMVLIGAVLVAVMSKQGGGEVPLSSGSGSQIAAGTLGQLDAGPQSPPPNRDAGTRTVDNTVDAAPAEPDAGATAPEPGGKGPVGAAEPQTASRRAKVRISFVADPPMMVYIKGKKVRSTPVQRELEVGSYKIKFVNEDTGETRTREIKVEAGRPQTIEPR